MIRQLAGLAGYIALFAGLLFLPAGTIHWRAAWILLATLALVRGVSTVLLWRSRRPLLEARSALPLPQAGQPWADRLLLPLSMAAFAGQIAVAASDVWHWRAWPEPAGWLSDLGLLLFVGGWGVVHLALHANAFALTVVRAQAERAQVVVAHGAYAIVRHPMYAGLLGVMVGQALWLRSTAAVVAVAGPGAVLAVRIVIEERVLRDALPGYGAYVARVPWRLVPGVW